MDTLETVLDSLGEKFVLYTELNSALDENISDKISQLLEKPNLENYDSVVLENFYRSIYVLALNKCSVREYLDNDMSFKVSVLLGEIYYNIHIKHEPKTQKFVGATFKKVEDTSELKRVVIQALDFEKILERRVKHLKVEINKLVDKYMSDYPEFLGELLPYRI